MYIHPLWIIGFGAVVLSILLEILLGILLYSFDLNTSYFDRRNRKTISKIKKVRLITWCIYAVASIVFFICMNPVSSNQIEVSEHQKIEQRIAKAQLEKQQKIEHRIVGSEKFKEILAFHSDNYAFTMLVTQQDQELYNDIYQSLMIQSVSLEYSSIEDDTVFRIFQNVLNDHPDIFWVSNELHYTTYNRNNVPYKKSITFTYINLESLDIRQNRIESALNNCIKNMDPSFSDYEKIRFVYEYLIHTTKYDDRISDQSMYSVLVDYRGVCAGYSKAFQYIMHQIEIPCLYVTGDLKSSSPNQNNTKILASYSIFENEIAPTSTTGHAWNMVKIDDSWVHVDVTSGDFFFTGQKNSVNNISYSYLCIPTSQIVKTHSIDSSFPLPQSTETQYNYYLMNHRYVSVYDFRDIKEMIIDDYNQGNSFVEIQFQTIEQLNICITELITNQNIYSIFDEMNMHSNSVRYSIDPELRLLRIDFPNS